ncbi:MAG TPA: spore germination protein GerW family protein [Terriglobales bacterium]|nr:spore germination protein GerW family protein [Terriglobales bacterium]
MELQLYFQSMLDSLRSSAQVKTIYGEPISAEGRTIVPVARVAYAFGSGFGHGPTLRGQTEGEQQRLGQGGGGGGSIAAMPVGVFEISTQGTRFVSISSRRKLAMAAAVGMVLGGILGWRRRRG